MLTLLLSATTPGASATPEIADLELSIETEADVPSPDSISAIPSLPNYWRDLVKGRRLDINDSTVTYPKFVDFCLRIYRWAERNFNTYDPAYVSGTGKHGKIRLLSDNWTDAYYFRFEEDYPIIMASTPYSNIGIQANYSILSASYSVDLNAAVSGKKSHHKKLGFSFSCARLYGEAYYWRNDGNTTIRKFGNDSSHKIYDINFDGINFKAFGVLGFYVFNYKKFSYPAAYNLSNYQLRSAGSWILGFTGTFYDCDFDFTRLPQNVLSEINMPLSRYRLDYNSVNIMGGYSYNWVINRHFMYNITTLPAIGVSFSFSDASAGRQEDFSIALRQMMSLTYTNRQFFVNATSSFHGNFWLTHQVGFMSGIENLQVSTGVRF